MPENLQECQSIVYVLQKKKKKPWNTSEKEDWSFFLFLSVSSKQREGRVTPVDTMKRVSEEESLFCSESKRTSLFSRWKEMDEEGVTLTFPFLFSLFPTKRRLRSQLYILKKESDFLINRQHKPIINSWAGEKEIQEEEESSEFMREALDEGNKSKSCSRFFSRTKRKEGSQEGGKDWSFLSRDRLSIDWLELGIYEKLVRKEKLAGEDNLNPVQKFDPKDKSKINMIWAVEAQILPLIRLEEQV